MVRRHGWQLPADTLQVIAVTVFCWLVAAYYTFFVPFAGGRVWEYVLIGVYSPVALLVFVLYVRCTAINTADPRIMSIFDFPHPLSTRDISRDFIETGSQLQSCPSSGVSRSFTLAANSSVRGSVGDEERVDSVPRKSCYNPLAIFCCVFVLDDCWKQEEEGNNRAGLYCMLCNSEVHKSSKHCKRCDKCVVGFDHHCKWLNNCVGRKNYMTFVSLMTATLLWLIIEAAVGVAVIVRVFADKKRIETEIVNRLGSSFSRAPLAAVVGVCTVVTIPACYHLSQLLFFHMLLIKKGLTTYDYLLAIRAMSEAPGGASADEEIQSVLYSPTGSATTGFSGGSSLGPPYKKGVSCTPPRMFDNQDEVIPQLDSHKVPSTVDPVAAERGIKAPKRSVKRSAWKLAKLDANEAARAAARARASSSVLRPIHNPHVPDNELSSVSTTVSIISSLSTDANVSARKEMRSKDLKPSGSRAMSNFSSPRHVQDESVTLATLPQYSTVSGHRFSATATHHMHRGHKADAMFFSAPSTSLPRDVRKTSSVVWDPEAGRYVSSAAVTNIPEVGNRLPDTRKPRPILPPQDSSALRAHIPLQQAERRLVYTSDSIFFGGPLVNIPTRNNQRSEGGLVREGQDRLASTLHQDARYKRDSTSHQLPVFVPKL